MKPRHLSAALLAASMAISALTSHPATAQSAQAAPRLAGQSLAEFAARRAAIRRALPDGVTLIRGERDPGDVERVRFRTTNNLMYLTGIETPDAILALLPDGNPTGKREILFVPGQVGWNATAMDPEPGPGAATERLTGIESVQEVTAMWAVLTPALQSATHLYLDAATTDEASYSPAAILADKARGINSRLTVTDGSKVVIETLRWRKTPGELYNLRRAVAATALGENNAAHSIRPGVTEISVEGYILAGFRRGEAPREGFPCIVGSGPNSTILHHFAGVRRIQPRETVVVDIGAEYNYYSADITRTFPSSGKFTPRQRELYQLVLDTQTACQKYVKPGKTTLWELHNYTVRFLKSSPLRAKAQDGREWTMDHFFIHGLGHWLGMDVHDVGGRSIVLEPGVVFTIEPGVYVPTEHIGIRIEDDYLVTPAGAEKLSRAIPCSVPDVEAWMMHRK